MLNQNQFQFIKLSCCKLSNTRNINHFLNIFLHVLLQPTSFPVNIYSRHANKQSHTNAMVCPTFLLYTQQDYSGLQNTNLLHIYCTCTKPYTEGTAPFFKYCAIIMQYLHSYSVICEGIPT